MLFRSFELTVRQNLPYDLVLNSSIAQSVEQRTVNPCVPGSSPGRGAKFKPIAHNDYGFLFKIH